MTGHEVFISYNTTDSQIVHHLAGRLVEAGIGCWLDVWSLIPGRAWQDDAEAALRSAQVVLVAIGEAGLGPWHHEELRTAIELRVGDPDNRRIIPVLLPGAREEIISNVPPFLRRMAWIDLTHGPTETGFQRIIAGIEGRAPGPQTNENPGVPPSDAKIIRDIDATLRTCTRWASQIQNGDGGLPSDCAGTYSCTWASAGLLWALLSAGKTDSASSWIRRAVTWILDNCNSDGGVPILTKGDTSIVDATAQGALACLPVSAATGSDRVTVGVRGLLEWILDHQQRCGGWSCFPGHEDPWTVSTAFALLALISARRTTLDIGRDVDDAIEGGRMWLHRSRNADAGWGPQQGLASQPAASGLAAHCVTELDGRASAAETVDYLFARQAEDGTWESTYDRPLGRTVIRFGTPYSLLGVASCTADSLGYEARLAYRGLMRHFDRDHFTFPHTSMHTWPTRDCVLALATLRGRAA